MQERWGTLLPKVAKTSCPKSCSEMLTLALRLRTPTSTVKSEPLDAVIKYPYPSQFLTEMKQMAKIIKTADGKKTGTSC